MRQRGSFNEADMPSEAEVNVWLANNSESLIWCPHISAKMKLEMCAVNQENNLPNCQGCAGPLKEKPPTPKPNPPSVIISHPTRANVLNNGAAMLQHVKASLPEVLTSPPPVKTDKAKVMPDPAPKGKPVGKERPAPKHITLAEGKNDVLIANVKELTIPLTEEDQALMEKLRGEAKRERRTIEQQILWLLEEHFLAKNE